MKSKIVTNRSFARLVLPFLVLCFGGFMPPLSAAQTDLVLVVVADQLRGDVPERFYDRFGPGGFRRLMDAGTRYGSARYRHANTVTCAGHATLATGGNAAQHGIVANEWFDVQAGHAVNCVEDERYAEIGSPPGSGGGVSPRRLISSTFGDELVRASAGRSRVFAVSLKDRSAVMLGGKLGKAWWYSKSTGRFVSSSYYYAQNPDWVQSWNAGNPADGFADSDWELLNPQSSYVFGDHDNRGYERPPAGLGIVFPHRLQLADRQRYYGSLRATPMADELTLDFVAALVAAEQPGRHGSTDVLAVSFSASDYIGHAFGPNSLEAEDNLLRLDRTLGRLLALIDREVGLDKTLVVLSSDHGICPVPEYLAEQGIETGRLDAAQFMGQVNAALGARFGTHEQLAMTFRDSGIYLNPAALAQLGLDAGRVERAVADEIARLPGFSLALARSDLLAGTIPGTPEAELVAASFYPGRSGDVIVVQKPFWYLDVEPWGNAAMHGSPWAYDTHVPLMLAGPGISHHEVYRDVAPRDLAPTISAYLGTPAPSGSVGVLLREVLESAP